MLGSRRAHRGTDRLGKGRMGQGRSCWWCLSCSHVLHDLAKARLGVRHLGRGCRFRLCCTGLHTWSRSSSFITHLPSRGASLPGSFQLCLCVHVPRIPLAKLIQELLIELRHSITLLLEPSSCTFVLAAYSVRASESPRRPRCCSTWPLSCSSSRCSRCRRPSTC